MTSPDNASKRTMLLTDDLSLCSFARIARSNRKGDAKNHAKRHGQCDGMDWRGGGGGEWLKLTPSLQCQALSMPTVNRPHTFSQATATQQHAASARHGEGMAQCIDGSVNHPPRRRPPLCGLAFMPPEEVVKYSAMTGQSLYYMGEQNLKHKILAIVEEEGAERASYALKLLQSEGELRIASTGKEATTGRLVTQEYRVEGPVMLFLTTTSIQVDEELLNRCLVLTVDEDREQTKAIHRTQRQRQTLEGLLASQNHQETLKLHRNAQRLLKPLLVANPFAERLTFMDNKPRTRRDNQKYLTLIRSIALLRQQQRPVTRRSLARPARSRRIALQAQVR